MSRHDSLNFDVLPNAYKTEIDIVKKRVSNNERMIEDQRKKQEILQELLRELGSQTNSESDMTSRRKPSSSRRRQHSRQNSSRSNGTDLSTNSLMNQFINIRQFMKENSNHKENHQSISNQQVKKDINQFKKQKQYDQLGQRTSIYNGKTIKWEQNMNNLERTTQKYQQFAHKIAQLKHIIKDNLDQRRQKQQYYNNEEKRRQEIFKKQKEQIRRQLIQQQKLRSKRNEYKNDQHFERKKRIFTQKAASMNKINESTFLQTECCINSFKNDRKRLNRILNRVQKGERACNKIMGKVLADMSSDRSTRF